MANHNPHKQLDICTQTMYLRLGETRPMCAVWMSLVTMLGASKRHGIVRRQLIYPDVNAVAFPEFAPAFAI